MRQKDPVSPHGRTEYALPGKKLIHCIMDYKIYLTEITTYYICLLSKNVDLNFFFNQSCSFCYFCIVFFRGNWKIPIISRSLPHARGGVSRAGKAFGTTLDSSPRTWGCCSKRAKLLRESFLVGYALSMLPQRSPGSQNAWPRTQAPSL